jgi:C-terminal processing protease CtpA/Prc
MQLPTSNGAAGVLCVLCGAIALVACGPPTWRGGIHAQLAWSEQGVRIVEVPPDGPAHRADLRAGDRIVAIDGRPVAGRDSAAVQRLLSGEVGSRATLEVLRDGRSLTIPVQRAPYARKAEAR